MRGVAFPVCLSVNDVVCHCSPYESDETVSFALMLRVVAVLEFETQEAGDVYRSFISLCFFRNYELTFTSFLPPYINCGTFLLSRSVCAAPCGFAGPLCVWLRTKPCTWKLILQIMTRLYLNIIYYCFFTPLLLF